MTNATNKISQYLMLQRRQSLEEEKTNKQIRTPETDTPSMKAIILANTNVNLFS